MKECRTFKFKKTGSPLDGKEVTHEVPMFDWEEFKNLPNANFFVKKAYDAELQKLVREIQEDGKNSTDEADLDSMESVITRSLRITEKEFQNWFDNRNWDACDFKNREQGLPLLKNILLELTKPSGSPHITPKKASRYASEFVAKVADKPYDKVADYLFSKLAGIKDSDLSSLI